jgi:hypothetical protein
MKKMLSIVLAVAVLAFASVSSAQELRDAKTATHATSSVVAFGAYNTTVPLLTGYSATSDLAGSLLAVYTADTAKTIVKTLSNASQTTLIVDSTAGFSAPTPSTGDYIVMQAPNLADGTPGAAEFIRISSITDGTHLVMTTNLATAQAVGNTVYEMKKVGSFAIGAATVSSYANALGILGGKKASPLVGVLNSTSAGTINVLGVQYLAK